VAMADTPAGMLRPPTLTADTVTDVPWPRMLTEDTLVSVLPVHVAIILRGRRAAKRALQGAAVTGAAAVIGEVITDIPGSATMDWVTAIRTMGMALTVTAPGGVMIRTTDIVPAGTILTGMATRPT
jgi:hypothetical protein